MDSGTNLDAGNLRQTVDAMTDDEWIAGALSTLPKMSEGKRVRLGSLFRDEPAVAQVLRFKNSAAATRQELEFDDLGYDRAPAV